MNKDLLTPEERTPYLTMDKCEITDDFGVGYDHEFEIWDIDGLLNAQLAKAQKARLDRPDREKIEAFIKGEIRAYTCSVCPDCARAMAKTIYSKVYCEGD